jgi:integrase
VSSGTLGDAIALGLGVFCGLRCHEIAKITWSDLNLRSSQLFVRGSTSDSKGPRLARTSKPNAQTA